MLRLLKAILMVLIEINVKQTQVLTELRKITDDLSQPHDLRSITWHVGTPEGD